MELRERRIVGKQHSVGLRRQGLFRNVYPRNSARSRCQDWRSIISTADWESRLFLNGCCAGYALHGQLWRRQLTAIDLKAQKPAWVFETEGAKQNAHAFINPDGSIRFEAVFRSPDLFYDDMVIAVDKLLSMGTILSSPVVVNDVVYVGSTDGNLYALK